MPSAFEKKKLIWGRYVSRGVLGTILALANLVNIELYTWAKYWRWKLCIHIYVHTHVSGNGDYSHFLIYKM